MNITLIMIIQSYEYLSTDGCPGKDIARLFLSQHIKKSGDWELSPQGWKREFSLYGSNDTVSSRLEMQAVTEARSPKPKDHVPLVDLGTDREGPSGYVGRGGRVVTS